MIDREPSFDSPDSNELSTGSPSHDEPVFLVIGKLHRPHGVKGEVLLEVITDYPERIKTNKIYYVGQRYTPIRLIGRRGHQDNLLLQFEGYDDRDKVSILTNQLVYVKTDELPPLPEGEFYHYQLLGLTVVDEGGQIIGRLEEVLETGANDVYVVKSETGTEILLPAVDEVILNIDIQQKVMQVKTQIWE